MENYVPVLCMSWVDLGISILFCLSDTIMLQLTLGAPALHTVHKPLLPQPILADISPDASTTLVDYSYTSLNTATNFSFP